MAGGMGAGMGGGMSGGMGGGMGAMGGMGSMAMGGMGMGGDTPTLEHDVRGIEQLMMICMVICDFHTSAVFLWAEKAAAESTFTCSLASH